jgi:dihydrolipoamide dehydrogenase
MAPTILSQEDGEVSALLEQSLKKQGIQIYTNTKTDSVEQKPYSVVLNLIHNNQPVKIEADKLLQAIGIAPNLRGLLGPDINLDLDKGYIKVDERYATNIPGIYASGDIIGPPWLAHIATFEAIQCVEGIFENKRPKRAKHIPACTYCQPQVASIGLTEEAAKKAGVSYKIGKFPFNASGKAVAANHPEGFVKVLVGDYDEILGAHIIGSEATELIAEYSLAMELEATVHEVHATIHPHPTFSEALAEAASAALRKAIHI